ncbi:MAG: hypothetical protein ACRDHK_09560, partial [Actinomycetota bacterium]
MVIVPDSIAAEPAPLLWEGVVQNPAGNPTTAEVVAFARPPADRLVAGEPVVRIAHTATDRSGRFTVRAAPDPALASLADDAGWITVMVAAMSEEGMTLAVDSVAWQPGADSTGQRRYESTGSGRWVSEPTELVRHTPDRFKGTTDTDDRSTAVPATERPRVLALSPAKAGPTPMSAGHSPDGGWCGPDGSQDMGRHLVAVGELHLNRQWGGFFDYTNTKSTSFQVGVSANGQRWSAGGSVSMAKERKSQNGGPIPDAADERLYTFKANMLFQKFKWICKPGLPNSYIAYTLEPVDWTGGMREVLGGAPPSCNNRNRDSVPPGKRFVRSDGSSVTLSGAISVGGFSGSM